MTWSITVNESWVSPMWSVVRLVGVSRCHCFDPLSPLEFECKRSFVNSSRLHRVSPDSSIGSFQSFRPVFRGQRTRLIFHNRPKGHLGTSRGWIPITSGLHLTPNGWDVGLGLGRVRNLLNSTCQLLRLFYRFLLRVFYRFLSYLGETPFSGSRPRKRQ